MNMNTIGYPYPLQIKRREINKKGSRYISSSISPK